MLHKLMLIFFQSRVQRVWGVAVLAFGLQAPFSDIFFHSNKCLPGGKSSSMEIVYPANILECETFFCGTWTLKKQFYCNGIFVEFVGIVSRYKY